MIPFDPAHQAVHYPPDRRFRIWIRPSVLFGFIIICLIPVVIAWVQWLVAGEPRITPVIAGVQGNPAGPHGFPAFVRYSHFFNFLFLTLMIRSGISILMDHPRFYFNSHCTPGSEWIRFTPLTVPKNRLWTAKDDARYITPLIGLPGYRHTVGIARCWHFITAYFFLFNGVVFLILLFITPQWRRLVPLHWNIFTEAWNVFVHYVTFHFPPEPDGYWGYNALQQLAYASTMFVMAPIMVLTGLAMSPALVNRFPWYPRLFGGRQGARSIHFLMMLGFVAFIISHVTLIVLTGFVRNMNHIVMGTDDLRSIGMILGFVGIGVVVALWIVAHYVSWYRPRALQHALGTINGPLLTSALARLSPRQKYTSADISPYFWPNGKLPVRDDWKQLAASAFADFRLRIGGLVENPVVLSLADLRAMQASAHITMHHCIQGWSGIAQWSGVPMNSILDLVRPRPGARVVAFFSFGPSLYGDVYYDTQTLENVRRPECLLALDMNGKPLSEVYGAPLRLRVENQLGFKMVKWIERIEIIDSVKSLGKGEGGKNEDDEYFDLLPYI